MRAVLWFRKCLRLHDNAPLHAILTARATSLLPIFILDPHFATEERVGYVRYKFLCETLLDLDSRLRSLGSRLFILVGDNPVDVLSRLFRLYAPSILAFESDTEPYALSRDTQVAQLASQQGVRVLCPSGHTLYDPKAIMKANGGDPPLTYNHFLRVIEQLPPTPSPLPTPKGPLPPSDPLDPSLIERMLQDEGLLFYSHARRSHVPIPEDYGYSTPSTPPSPFRGGETEALTRLQQFLSDRTRTCTFRKPDTDPTRFDPCPSTTVLSPYLKFGSLSPRLFKHSVEQVYRESREGFTRPPQSLLGQLYFREFFYCCSVGIPGFDSMESNPLCKKIAWNGDRANPKLRAWEEGRTGFPFIDAAMRQLHEWGWMHHLARHCVACFLTRGNLWVHWELGRDVFDRLLLDADWALNNANWLWLSASAFFSEYFRIYSPIDFAKKYDPSGRFVRRFVPELRLFPDSYIYEPWKAPLDVQRRAGCLVGKGPEAKYPRPIVEYASSRKVNLEKMRLAYEENDRNGVPDVWERGTSNQRREIKGRAALHGQAAAVRTGP